MKIKKYTDYPKLDGFSNFESAILAYNNIDFNDLRNLLPNVDNPLEYTLEDYLQNMEPIDFGDKFVDILERNKNKTICVIGDYDCDGIMGTSIMCYGLTVCGYKTTFTISNRFETGYGMHKEQIDTAIANGAEVIVTVDNGITANDAIDYAHSKGLLVLVTDHHTPQEENHADLCVDPLYNNDKFKMISGATVALKLIYKLYQKYHFDVEIMRNFAAMAYLTVYSDVMPVLGENRFLICAAEAYLNSVVNQKGTFINRLSDLVDFYAYNKTSDPYLNLEGSFKAFNKNNVDFYFVPVINACNRVLGDVNDLVYDIMSLFSGEYSGVPHLYSGINKKRKFMKTELVRKHKPNDLNATVEALTPDMWDDNYAGIVGLVASTVVENESKPALIGIDKPGVIHFSGRSVSGFNLFNALTEIKNEHPELHLMFGGHAEALGASCLKSEIPLLEEYLSEKFAGVAVEKAEPTYLLLETPDDVVKGYNHLYPFGNKFELPKFYYEDTIRYLYKDERCFTMKGLGDYKIKFYDKTTLETISKYTFEKRDDQIRCVLSMIQDDSNQLVFKLDKLIS